jgi:quinol monooxygenase YgiN
LKKEPVTLTYIIHRGTDDRDKFFVYEKYRAKADLDFHASTPYFNEFSKAMGPLVAGRPEISFYQELE